MTLMLSHGLSDTGVARLHNEDAFRIDGERGLYVVADGMGGHTHGEVASQIAVKTIGDFFSNRADRTVVSRSDGSDLQAHSVDFKTAIELAHQAMLQAINEDLRLQGMGTTVAGIVVQDGIVAVGHVGDSRVYRLRDGQMELLTEDHTWVNEQVVAGYLTAEQARTHPLRNVVTRALGGEAAVVVDLQETPVCKGDLYLICSDGLTAMLSDLDIQARLTRGLPLTEICKKLIDDSNARGGVDNVTAILARIEEDSSSA